MLLIDILREHAEDFSKRNSLNEDEAICLELLRCVSVYELSTVVPLFDDWQKEKRKRIPHRPPHQSVWAEWSKNINLEDGVAPIRIGGLITHISESSVAEFCEVGRRAGTEYAASIEKKMGDADEVWLAETWFAHTAVPTSLKPPESLAFRRVVNKPILMNSFGFFAMSDNSTLVESFVFNRNGDVGNFGLEFGSSYWLLEDQEPLWPPIMAFALLHCRNVVAEDVRPDEAVNRRLAKTGQPSRVTYKVLKIEAPADRRKHNHSDVGGNDEGPKVRFHVCSGHVKHLQSERYKEKRGQWVWCPAHWKGSKELGEVHKRYQVDAKK